MDIITNPEALAVRALFEELFDSEENVNAAVIFKSMKTLMKAYDMEEKLAGYSEYELCVRHDDELAEIEEELHQLKVALKALLEDF